jgi:hypothetical protein
MVLQNNFAPSLEPRAIYEMHSNTIVMDDTVCGGGIVQTPRGLCSLARVSTALGVKHLIAQSGLTFTSTCLGQD